MEIFSVKLGSLRIKSKNAVIVIDPSEKVEADIVFNLSGKIEAPNSYDEALLIQGAGEYEVKGVSIFGKGTPKGTIYTILADTMKVLLLSSSAIELVKDTDDVTAVIIKVETEIEDTVLALSSTSLLLFYDQTNLIKLSADKVTKASKVNLKKREELAGSTIILTND